jgi:hypothetical protein
MQTAAGIHKEAYSWSCTEQTLVADSMQEADIRRQKAPGDKADSWRQKAGGRQLEADRCRQTAACCNKQLEAEIKRQTASQHKADIRNEADSRRQTAGGRHHEADSCIETAVILAIASLLMLCRP